MNNVSAFASVDLQMPAEDGGEARHGDDQRSASNTAETDERNEAILPEEQRDTWGNGLQFLLACISYAVGLGNIWRFPSVVYENRGGAFLIPYLCCTMLVAFPVLFLELSLGQYARVGPSVIYGRIKPAFHGLGWAMVVNSVLTGIFYNIVVAWCLIYIVVVLVGWSERWSRCENAYNTICRLDGTLDGSDCQSQLEDARCSGELDGDSFFFNGSCYLKNDTVMEQARKMVYSNLSAMSPAEEFYNNFVLERSTIIGPLMINWKMCMAYFVVFALTALALFKGTKIIGRISYVMAVVPYIIIIIFFGRAITLDGYEIGLDYYLFKPDWTVVYDAKAWQAAATQVCFSLSPGFGGILSFATYNKKSHNVYRDAFLICVADSFMSVFGGTAVFCTLGFMSKQLGVPIDQVVQDGTALAFVAYPEAMARMPVSWFWSFLFFLMMFLLGISTEFGFLETIITAFTDQFPVLGRNKALTTFGVCGVMFLCGMCMCTEVGWRVGVPHLQSGFYFFSLINAYAAGFSLTFCVFSEAVLIAHFYGVRHFVRDLRSMFGPPKHLLGRLLGPTGYYVQFIWVVVGPILWATMTFLLLYSQIQFDFTVGKGARTYHLPTWTVVIGWFCSCFPLLCFPVFAIYNYLQFKRRGQGVAELWRCQPAWPSCDRICQRELEETESDQSPDEERMIEQKPVQS